MNIPVKDNWIESNIKERLQNKTCDFLVKMNPRPVRYMSFYNATKEAAFDIANKNDNIFIGLSGGLDSEYLMVLLHELKIPFKPIILDTIGNKIESEFAFHKCKQLGIEPIVLTCDEIQYLSIYKKYIAETISGNAIWSVPNIFTSLYAKKNSGIVIIADHPMNEHSHDNPDPTATLVSAGECEFYLTVYDMPYYIFYYYTPEILYAMVKEFDNSRLQYFKAKLYNLPFRPKIQFNFGENFLEKFRQIYFNIPGMENIKRSHILGNKQEFLSILKSWNNV